MIGFGYHGSLDTWPDLARVLVLILSGGSLGFLVIGLLLSVAAWRDDAPPGAADVVATLLTVIGVGGLILLNAEAQLGRLGLPATWRLFVSVPVLLMLILGLSAFSRFRWRARIELVARRRAHLE